MGAFSPFRKLAMSAGTASMPVEAPRAAGNPNPHRFTVFRFECVGKAVVAEVIYPDCTNYEGRKILVFASATTFSRLISKGVMDPHFTKDRSSPVARFEPTERGWGLALRCAAMLK